MNFKEKLTFYDKIQVSDNIIDNLNEIGQNLAINNNFIKRLNHRIYNWYVDWSSSSVKICVRKRCIS